MNMPKVKVLDGPQDVQVRVAKSMVDRVREHLGVGRGVGPWLESAVAEHIELLEMGKLYAKDYLNQRFADNPGGLKEWLRNFLVTFNATGAVNAARADWHYVNEYLDEDAISTKKAGELALVFLADWARRFWDRQGTPDEVRIDKWIEQMASRE